MSDKLTYNITNQGDATHVAFTGQIDEDSEFTQLESLTTAKVIFDFNQVSLINSCGVREWIVFIEKLPANISIQYEHCPQVIIEQINMVHGFIRKGTVVKSFYAPYFSEDKDEVIQILLTYEQVKDGKAPDIEKDGEELEFDAIEAQYFQFLKQME